MDNNISPENNILYVIKMLTHEKDWCHHITFNYDYNDIDLSTLSFFIGPIEYSGKIIRNKPDNYDNPNFIIPNMSDDILNAPNSFFIFIDDNNLSGRCFMVLNKKIFKFKETHPKIKSNYLIIDKQFIYNNSFWVSILPSNEDKMLLYPNSYIHI